MAWMFNTVVSRIPNLCHLFWSVLCDLASGSQTFSKHMLALC